MLHQNQAILAFLWVYLAPALLHILQANLNNNRRVAHYDSHNDITVVTSQDEKRIVTVKRGKPQGTKK